MKELEIEQHNFVLLARKALVNLLGKQQFGAVKDAVAVDQSKQLIKNMISGKYKQIWSA